MNGIGSGLGNSITEFLSRMSTQGGGEQPAQPAPEDRAELSPEARKQLG